MQPPMTHPFTPGTRVMYAHAHTKGIVGGVLFLLVLVAIAIAVRKHKNNTNHNLPRSYKRRTFEVKIDKN